MFTFNVCQGWTIFSRNLRANSKFQATEGRKEVHIEYPQILCVTVQNSVARATYRPGFVQP